jgi:hypothetical protein
MPRGIECWKPRGNKGRFVACRPQSPGGSVTDEVDVSVREDYLPAGVRFPRTTSRCCGEPALYGLRASARTRTPEAGN